MLAGLDLAAQPDLSGIAVYEGGFGFKLKPIPLTHSPPGTYAEAVAKLQASFAAAQPALIAFGVTIKQAIKQLQEHEFQQIKKASLGK